MTDKPEVGGGADRGPDVVVEWYQLVGLRWGCVFKIRGEEPIEVAGPRRDLIQHLSMLLGMADVEAEAAADLKP